VAACLLLFLRGLSAELACVALDTGKIASRLRGPDSHRIEILPQSDVYLPFAEDWSLDYKFSVPRLPSGPDWDRTAETFYIWGDVDFDTFGKNGRHPISEYTYNQIVPQLMIGQTICGNEADYQPRFCSLDGWVVQASYFWAKDLTSDDRVYSLTGDMLNVSPGEDISTKIAYDAQSGAITMSISAQGRGTSEVVIPRPFPDNPSLFSSWKSFFSKGRIAIRAHLGCRSVPCIQHRGAAVRFVVVFD